MKFENTIGIVVPHLGSSQIAYETIKLTSKLNNCIIFFEQLVEPCFKIDCAVMCINEMVGFTGILITSNINNTIMSDRLINRTKSKLYFYVWDLEWLRPTHKDFLYNRKAYTIPDKLISHKEHIGPIRNYCNRTPDTKDFQRVLL